MRYAVPALLAVSAIGCGLWLPARWALWVLVPLLIVAVWDFLQREHSLRRNYPLIARIRWLFEDLRPYLRAYIVESDREGRPFTIGDSSFRCPAAETWAANKSRHSD